MEPGNGGNRSTLVPRHAGSRLGSRMVFRLVSSDHFHQCVISLGRYPDVLVPIDAYRYVDHSLDRVRSRVNGLPPPEWPAAEGDRPPGGKEQRQHQDGSGDTAGGDVTGDIA